jgi:hypothetical protein
MFSVFLILSVLGVAASANGLYGIPAKWKVGKELHIKLGMIHKYLARGVLIFGFVTTTSGLIRYQ